MKPKTALIVARFISGYVFFSSACVLAALLLPLFKNSTQPIPKGAIVTLAVFIILGIVIPVIISLQFWRAKKWAWWAQLVFFSLFVFYQFPIGLIVGLLAVMILLWLKEGYFNINSNSSRAVSKKSAIIANELTRSLVPETTEFKVTCPNCDQRFLIDNSYIGTNLSCATCNVEFFVQK